MNSERAVEAIRRRIGALVGRRQELRARDAGPHILERNRLAIVRAQQELSLALLALHGQAAPASRAA